MCRRCSGPTAPAWSKPAFYRRDQALLYRLLASLRQAIAACDDAQHTPAGCYDGVACCGRSGMKHFGSAQIRVEAGDHIALAHGTGVTGRCQHDAQRRLWIPLHRGLLQPAIERLAQPRRIMLVEADGGRPA